MTDATAYYLWTIVDNVWILSSTSCYTSLMKWNVNAAALISETTKQESQTPFIVVLLTFFWEFLEYLFFKIRFHCWGPFIVKLHTETLLKKSSSQGFSNDFFDIFQSSYFEVIACETKSKCKRSLGQLYQKREFCSGTLKQMFSYQFWKKESMTATFNSSAGLSLK